MSIIWFLIIIYIVFIVYKNKNDKVQNIKNINDITRSKISNPNNSYYSNNKVSSYKKMNEDHISHEDVKDITDSIGYKRCPNCGSLISKKSATCFMCNYEFMNSSID